MKCVDRPMDEFLSLDHLPKDELYAQISKCVCRQAYGQGTEEIDGIAVCIPLIKIHNYPYADSI